MNDENCAIYAKIGLVVMLAAIAIVASLIYLGGLRGREDVVEAETYCDRSVSGLSVGSAVNFRGVKLGEVSAIGFVGDVYDVKGTDNQRVYIQMKFPRRNLDTRIDEGIDPERLIKYLVDEYSVRATVAASGITGLSRIELDIIADAKKPEPLSWTPRSVYIPSAPSLLDGFSDSATKVMNQINKMDIAAMWSNVCTSVSSLAKVAESTQGMLESRQADIEKVMGDLSEGMGAVRRLAVELTDNPSMLIRERVPRALPETK